MVVNLQRALWRTSSIFCDLTPSGKSARRLNERGDIRKRRREGNREEARSTGSVCTNGVRGREVVGAAAGEREVGVLASLVGVAVRHVLGVRGGEARKR